ncbi:MAG: hypothetical protein ACTSWY_10540 [Promethearchaeota archaeon]
MKKTTEEIIEAIDIYKKCRPEYVKFTEVLDSILKKMTKSISSAGIIQTRVKSVSSYVEKILRPNKTHLYGKDPTKNMTDLSAGRVIFATKSDVTDFCKKLENNFLCEEHEDKSKQLDVGQFGYGSEHYIVLLNPDSFYLKDLNIPEKMFSFKAEIQVRTFLQHSWSVIGHTSLYKPKFHVPDKLSRTFYRIAAILEDADESLQNALNLLNRYEEDVFWIYLPRSEIIEEIERYELIYENIPDRLKEIDLVLKIAKLAKFVSKWDLTINILSDFVDSKNPSILRELGVALCRKNSKNLSAPQYKLGQKYLEEAIKINPKDTDSLTSLGGSWRKIDKKKADMYFSHAYKINPNDPYTAVNYFQMTIAINKNTEIIKYSLPAIQNILDISKKQISLGINIPWAYYNTGLFQLFLGDNILKSLSNYLLGLKFSTVDWTISSTLNTLDSFSCVENELNGFKMVKQLLLLGLTILFDDNETRERLRKEFCVKEEKLSTPLVIIAGTTNLGLEEIKPDFKSIFLNAFKSYTGTIISGGTNAGIADLAGKIQNTYPNSLKTIGYIPNNLSENKKIEEITDGRYSRIHKTEGSGFSILEPLQYWTDIVLNNIDISKIKLLGVGGGEISAFEYRLALVFGANVGILSKSGRSGQVLLQNPLWQGSNLIKLENNSKAVENFLLKR